MKVTEAPPTRSKAAGPGVHVVEHWSCPWERCVRNGQTSSHDRAGTSLTAHLRVVHKGKRPTS